MSKAETIVYAGRGSSHSWTWLADLFEAHDVPSVRFLDSRAFISSLEKGGPRVAIVSGGDGFEIAEALKGQGFRNLKEFVLNGGTFAGICAGAYLPLPSSLEPFRGFNISTTKIENIICEPRLGSRSGPRGAITYGNCSVIHPIRGPVEISDESGESVIAPLYGGPVFREPNMDSVVMRYESFTLDTEFQMERDGAMRMMRDRPAVIRVALGSGSLLLFGPHLEHPSYPEANGLFLKLLAYDRSERTGLEAVPTSERPMTTELRRSISDLKVAILGLENRSFTVGHKSWDGGRLLELVSAIEKRGWSLDAASSKLVASDLGKVRNLLVGRRVGIESDADETPSLLVEAARTCVDDHFAVLSEKAGKPIADSSGDSSRAS